MQIRPIRKSAPFLHRGIVWLCFPFSEKQSKLFPGDKQCELYRKIMESFMKIPAVKWRWHQGQSLQTTSAVTPCEKAHRLVVYQEVHRLHPVLLFICAPDGRWVVFKTPTCVMRLLVTCTLVARCPVCLLKCVICCFAAEFS
jgi:hypothetical protein